MKNPLLVVVRANHAGALSLSARLIEGTESPQYAVQTTLAIRSRSQEGCKRNCRRDQTRVLALARLP